MPSKLIRTKEYKCWCVIKQRCLNPNCSRYDSYGGKGITICKEWENSFQCFIKDMGYPPNKNYSIDRIDNTKGYCKENCRWATWEEQYKNRESTINYNGLTLREICRERNLNLQNVYSRLNDLKWDFEKAINTPTKKEHKEMKTAKLFENKSPVISVDNLK